MEQVGERKVWGAWSSGWGGCSVALWPLGDGGAATAGCASMYKHCVRALLSARPGIKNKRRGGCATFIIMEMWLEERWWRKGGVCVHSD